MPDCMFKLATTTLHDKKSHQNKWVCDTRHEVNMVLGGEHEELRKKAFQRVIDVCKKFIHCERFLDDFSWKCVGWKKWCEGIDEVLADMDFKQLALARQYLWGRRRSRGDYILTHGMAMQGEANLTVLGIFLAFDKS